MTSTDFIQQIREAKTDIQLVGLLSWLFPGCEMAIIVAALARAHELILKQKGIEL